MTRRGSALPVPSILMPANAVAGRTGEGVAGRTGDAVGDRADDRTVDGSGVVSVAGVMLSVNR
ncbi:MAG: hypothetical protein LBK67_02800 [Coriobacteriales bacterium]|jgi:hypothetical protein|nr:hypothetical protein [Coriobacteriales bacterium]